MADITDEEWRKAGEALFVRLSQRQPPSHQSPLTTPDNGLANAIGRVTDELPAQAQSTSGKIHFRYQFYRNTAGSDDEAEDAPMPDADEAEEDDIPQDKFYKEFHIRYEEGRQRDQYRFSGKQQLQISPQFVTHVSTPEGMQSFGLKRHQREGIGFMRNLYHRPDVHGCILADDTGCGKTMEAIGLLLTIGSDAGPNLVVSPTNIPTKWKRHVERFLQPDSTNICFYEGKNRFINDDEGKRNVSQADLEAYDIVITTYSTLEAEQRVFENWRFKTNILRKSYADSRADAEDVGLNPNFEVRSFRHPILPDFTAASTPRQAWPMGEVQWNVIVLDEAHCLQNSPI